MEWLHRMNQAMQYIEANLTNEIDYTHAARLVCCSTYHFQRMFSFITGVSLSEYIRCRRLALAATELQTSSIKVVDLALRYGYESPTAFNRAFQNMHGVAPNAARGQGVWLKAYPPMTFQITIKGAVEMNYRLEKREAFRVVGAKLQTTVEGGKSYGEIPRFWGDCYQNGRFAQVMQLIGGEPQGILGLSACHDNGWKNEFDYYIAAATHQPTPNGLHEYCVPAATWAIFECIGPLPGALQEMQKRIVTEWLPTSGYEYGHAPDIELYTAGDNTAPDYKTEVWVPVIKKA